jgi:hypothetical protein
MTEPPAATPLLYGVPGAEELHDDPAACFEADIEPWWEDGDHMVDAWQIEEWTSLPARTHLPTTDWIIDHVTEWLADNGDITEPGMDSWERHAKAPDVVDALDAWLDRWASRVGYLYADRHVRTLTVTRDPDGQPLLDGEPMYQPAATTEGGDSG